jgi:damage-control phosphatase, subfamily I
MKTYLDCIPCFLRQALEAARMVSDDPELHQRVLRSVLSAVARMDLRQAPPAMAREIHQIIRAASGDPDPYRGVKDSSNELVLGLLPGLRRRVAESSDPLQTAIRLAIAGNVIDYGVRSDLTDEQVRGAIAWSLEAPLDLEALEALRAEILRAGSILYLADNAGEIVCDRLLLELLPLERVVLAVKGSPVINDATRADAVAAGLTELVQVVDNGSDVPGTILSRCSESFRRSFYAADLVIAKGQGNYETLSEADRRVYLLFKAKCPVIARDVGREVGELVIARSR